MSSNGNLAKEGWTSDAGEGNREGWHAIYYLRSANKIPIEGALLAFVFRIPSARAEVEVNASLVDASPTRP